MGLGFGFGFGFGRVRVRVSRCRALTVRHMPASRMRAVRSLASPASAERGGQPGM